MRNIAVFASGSGTNAENIITYFQQRLTGRVTLVLCNKTEAKVLERAERLGVQTVVFDRDTFLHSDRIVQLLHREKIDYLVLAGFLWLVPLNIIKSFEGRILNIHPALLPRHGGQGMYGDRVHRAVIEHGDSETGITIHHVNEVYDSGAIVAQYRIPIRPKDTPESVAQRVHALEYEHYPRVIESEIKKL